MTDFEIRIQGLLDTFTPLTERIDRYVYHSLKASVLDPENYNKKVKQRHSLKRELKYAKVLVGGQDVLCMIDTKTDKAYKLMNREATWIELKKFTFDRWASGFDL